LEDLPHENLAAIEEVVRTGAEMIDEIYANRISKMAAAHQPSKLRGIQSAAV
jgi:hypothetical protein